MKQLVKLLQESMHLGAALVGAFFFLSAAHADSPPPPPNETSSEANKAPAEATVLPTPTLPAHVISPQVLRQIQGKSKGKHHVWVYSDPKGDLLIVDGKPFFVKGMNWDYMPIGTNYNYDMWKRPDAFVKKALDDEMSKLQAMGVNAIRLYPFIPPRWVTYIYENYGIYSVINPIMGRYGMTIEGVWDPNPNHRDPKVRKLIKQETMAQVRKYKDTPGLLMWLLGNENNYSLHWSSFEIEQLPKDDRWKAKADYMYSLFGEVIDEIHQLDPMHPVSMANGDIQYLDLIVKHCSNLDMLSSNVYRGKNATDMFKRVKKELNKPLLLSEFGSDAFNAKTMQEAPVEQAQLLLSQWQELYLESYGKGGYGNSLGGLTFQWSDGWWKYKMEENLDIHDTNASWANGGYTFDFVKGQNNMNEEWFGICAKGPTDNNGHFSLIPRPAYYVLRDAYQLPAYDAKASPQTIRQHFKRIRPSLYLDRYRSGMAMIKQKQQEKYRVSNLRLEMSTIGSGGTAMPNPNLAIDTMQSVYTQFTAQPNPNLRADVSFNVTGNVPQNRIDELFYEARGATVELTDVDGQQVLLTDQNRIQLYQGNIDWSSPYADLKGYYRTGHYHWAYEGDFFGLYQEANYGNNIDIYNAVAPVGTEIAFKKRLAGLKIALGPQIYWGANPGLIAKYYKKLQGWEFALVHHEDVTSQASIASSQAIPQQLNRKSSLYLKKPLGSMNFELAGLWSGSPRIGDSYLWVQEAKGTKSYANQSGYDVIQDEISPIDTLGGRAKISGRFGRINAYLQGGYHGLVSDGAGDPAITYTGWHLKAPGRGNHVHALTGMTYLLGHFQIAPNFLYQNPLIGPLPAIEGFYDRNTDVYYRGIIPRNVLADPFQVLDNRETLAAELLFVYDPTPSTWFWQWDNAIQEDADFSASLGFVYRHQPTSRDANIGFNEERIMFGFASAPPAKDLWEIRSRIVSASSTHRFIANVTGGLREANGDSERFVHMMHTDVKYWYKKWGMNSQFLFNHWGPFDYYRDYNITFPFQFIGDFYYSFSKQRMDNLHSRFGLNAKFRTLDEYSQNDFVPDPNAFRGWTTQYEVGSYVIVGF